MHARRHTLLFIALFCSGCLSTIRNTATGEDLFESPPSMNATELGSIFVGPFPWGKVEIHTRVDYEPGRTRITQGASRKTVDLSKRVVAELKRLGVRTRQRDASYQITGEVS